jgi:hypothetical protein
LPLNPTGSEAPFCARPGACVPQVMNPEVLDAGAQDVEQQLAVDYDGCFSGL